MHDHSLVLYHEINKDKVESILLHGLVLGAGGDKRDASIVKTDKFLNDCRSKKHLSHGIDRLTNIYCYLSEGEKVIDITSGKLKDPHDIPHSSEQTLLYFTPDQSRCYVSDLDLYDTIKSTLNKGITATARNLATIYWQKITPLHTYDRSFRRPEVLVTYNIPATQLSRID